MPELLDKLQSASTHGYLSYQELGQRLCHTRGYPNGAYCAQWQKATGDLKEIFWAEYTKFHKQYQKLLKDQRSKIFQDFCFHIDQMNSSETGKF